MNHLLATCKTSPDDFHHAGRPGCRLKPSGDTRNSRVCSTEYQDSEDPMAILAEASRRKLSADDDPVSLEAERTLGVITRQHPQPAVACEIKDPCELIEAMLKMSKHVRDRVFERQARVLKDYSAETHSIERELAVLLPSNSQYLAACEEVKCRHRQQTTPKAEASICHPLNFHLRVADGGISHARAPGCPLVDYPKDRLTTNRGSVDRDEPMSTRRAVPVDSEEGAGKGEHRTREDAECKEEAPHSPLRGKERHGSPGDESHRMEHVIEDVTYRRWSSQARAGSTSMRFRERPLTLCRGQAKQSPGNNRRRSDRVQGCVCALQRSKVRGRQMIFSLLEAAHAEEGTMEEKVSTSLKAFANDKKSNNLEHAEASRQLEKVRTRNARELFTLLAEYDPRLDNNHREGARAKARMALPWPTVLKVDKAGTATGTASNITCLFKSSPSTVPAWRDSASDRHRSTNDAGGVECEGCLENNTVPKSNRGNEAAGRDDAQIKDGNKAVVEIREESDGDGDTPDSDHFQAEVTKGRYERYCRPLDENDDDRIGGSEFGGGGECRTLLGLPPETVLHENPYADEQWQDIASGVREESSDDRQVREDRGAAPSRSSRSGEPCHITSLADEAEHKSDCEFSNEPPAEYAKAPQNGARSPPINPLESSGTGGQRKKPTLPDPNEVNTSVMVDPFNMDHMKDLPGLVGGYNRELSDLVSAAVTYTDPAFPNLEFHRRTAMDGACYFMPGYKPRVNPPGQDAGAYWLERRHSYRVKMTDPFHESPQASSDRQKSGGRQTRKSRVSPRARPYRRYGDTALATSTATNRVAPRMNARLL